MTPEENDLITSLFDRLRSAEGGLQKDREAEQLIARQVAAQPAAPYQLAQTVLVQEHALHNAQQRIADLERQLAASRTEERTPQSGGSFLSGLLGGNSGRDRAAATPPPLPTGSGAVPMQASAPPPAPSYPSTTNLPPSAGGGFLRSALATAAGVAGGSLLFQGIGNLLGHNAGPFSSFMGSGGGGGFGAAGFAGGPMPMGGGGNTETINNYYGDAGGGSGGGGGFMEGGHGHHGGGGETVGDFADQGARGDSSAGFEPSDFDTNLPPDDGFQNLVDDNNAGADPGGFFDDGGGGSSDDGTVV